MTMTALCSKWPISYIEIDVCDQGNRQYSIRFSSKNRFQFAATASESTRKSATVDLNGRATTGTVAPPIALKLLRLGRWCVLLQAIYRTQQFYGSVGMEFYEGREEGGEGGEGKEFHCVRAFKEILRQRWYRDKNS